MYRVLRFVIFICRRKIFNNFYVEKGGNTDKVTGLKFMRTLKISVIRSTTSILIAVNKKFKIENLIYRVIINFNFSFVIAKEILLIFSNFYMHDKGSHMAK